MTAITINIPGHVVPKGRPRMTRSGHTYTPRPTRDYEAVVRDAATVQIAAARALAIYAPVAVEIRIDVAVPKSWGRKRAALALLGQIVPTTRPDIDNCVKSITDALNGIAYRDDAQIVSLTATRRYSEGDGATVTISPIAAEGTQGRLGARL